MAESIGWDWENVTSRSHWLKPIGDCYYLANKWKDAGYASVLDLGTGLGRHAICFAKHGLKVSAMDISDYSIQHLQSWAANENLIIDASVGDMLSLPYPDQSFDCVFTYHVVSHSDTPGVKRIIQEIERVLKPQGEVFLSFCSKETTDFMESRFPMLDDNTMICQEEPEMGAPHFYVNLPDILDLLPNFNIESVKHTEYCDLNIQNDRIAKYYYISAALR